MGFTTIDADPATGSVATDSAITKAIIVRAKRIIVPSTAKMIDNDRLGVKSYQPSEGGFYMKPIVIWQNNAQLPLIRIKDAWGVSP